MNTPITSAMERPGAAQPDTGSINPAIRKDFPILGRTINGKPLTYLDSAATSQKPSAVIGAIAEYYATSNANVHRGAHFLGNEATAILEDGRNEVAGFIDADPAGIVFVRNTTEALNLVASVSTAGLGEKDRVVLTQLEHHSNVVPWQLARERRHFDLQYIRVGDDGQLDLEHAALLMAGPTRIVSISHASNVLGTLQPVEPVIAAAHACEALVCIDAAQTAPHRKLSVRDLDCDFIAFSGHKMLGPMGIGVLWARPSLLERLGPFLGGGSMIDRVDSLTSTWAEVPHKFEAGTPDVAGVAGMRAAINYLNAIGMENIAQHDLYMGTLIRQSLEQIAGVTVLGSEQAATGTVSFSVAGVHPHDVATILDREGIAVRAGHHCCQPLMHRLGVSATTRASSYLYNNPQDVSTLVAGVRKVIGIFA